MNVNWGRPFADLSSALPVSVLRLGPRARRRLQREGVLGAGAVAAMIAAANASAHDGDAGLVIAEVGADSLDDILSFAALCATGGAVAVGGDHALHESDALPGHGTHAFFDDAFVSRLASSLCGDDSGDHAEHRGAAVAAHDAHADDHGAGAAQAASHAGHGEVHLAAHAAALGAEPHAAGGHGDDAHADSRADAGGDAHADHGLSGHAVLAASAGQAQHADHVPNHDPAALHVLAAASDDDGDATPGLNALLGARDPGAAAPSQTPVQESAAIVYNPADHAAHDLPPAPVEI
ncbi:MAG: hypothetical protein VX640_07370 [Pseudomonadota bacterium]|nr:hypothetical protein [Pseudomonadota bacterium]